MINLGIKAKSYILLLSFSCFPGIYVDGVVGRIVCHQLFSLGSLPSWLVFILHLQYYAESHGVIYVIDSTDEDRLSESKEAFGKEHICTWFDI